MNVITALIVFSALGALISAKSRAAVPALIFGVFAVVLFCTTPLGAGLPDLLASVVGWVGDSGAAITNVAATG